MPRPIMIYLVILTSIGWAINLAATLLKDGAGDPAVNGIFAIVVGALFAFGNRKPPKSGRPSGEDAE